MRSETFLISSRVSARFWQVILGAFLATGGGLVASQLQNGAPRRGGGNAPPRCFFGRGRCFGASSMILKRAAETKKIGNPYGPITLRMLRSARRRNRHLRAQSRKPARPARCGAQGPGFTALLSGLPCRLTAYSMRPRRSADMRPSFGSRNLDERDREEFSARAAEIKELREFRL